MSAHGEEEIPFPADASRAAPGDRFIEEVNAPAL
jgi:hypothetical protein